MSFFSKTWGVFFKRMDILHKWLLETPGSHNKMRPSCHGAAGQPERRSHLQKKWLRRAAGHPTIALKQLQSTRPLKPGKVSSTILSNPDKIYDIRIWWVLSSHILSYDLICLWKHRSGSGLLFLAGTKAYRGSRVPVQTSVGLAPCSADWSLNKMRISCVRIISDVIQQMLSVLVGHSPLSALLA